jgi:hypothetical protein
MTAATASSPARGGRVAFGWHGSKAWLAPKIAGFAAGIPNRVYIEPYVKAHRFGRRYARPCLWFIGGGLDRWSIDGHHDLRLVATMKAQVLSQRVSDSRFMRCKPAPNDAE